MRTGLQQFAQNTGPLRTIPPKAAVLQLTLSKLQRGGWGTSYNCYGNSSLTTSKDLYKVGEMLTFVDGMSWC